MSNGLQMKYFILKPKGADAYAKASRRAMDTYARMIREENPQLADELEDWTGREYIAAHKPSEGGSDD